ncbi:MAG: 50S ribosomal protein L6 [Candidatus Nealsonbacteria bacterium]
MSRIGKKPIEIPSGVEVKTAEGQVFIKGPKGELSLTLRPEVKVEAKDNKIQVSLIKEGANAFWGLTRALLQNAVRGVSEGYEKNLELVGVGYRAALEGKDLSLTVGFSHPVKILAPEGIAFSVEKNFIKVVGIDKGLVGQIAATIRKVRPPEPYKGKGIKYVDEHIIRKEGKKAVGTSS